jgi:hypothetical protein
MTDSASPPNDVVRKYGQDSERPSNVVLISRRHSNGGGSVKDIQDTLDRATRTRFTGTIEGPIERDPETGQDFRPVFSYQHGECVDAYVTLVSLSC